MRLELFLLDVCGLLVEGKHTSIFLLLLFAFFGDLDTLRIFFRAVQGLLIEDE